MYAIHKCRFQFITIDATFIKLHQYSTGTTEDASIRRSDAAKVDYPLRSTLLLMRWVILFVSILTAGNVNDIVLSMICLKDCWRTCSSQIKFMLPINCARWLNGKIMKILFRRRRVDWNNESAIPMRTKSAALLNASLPQLRHSTGLRHDTINLS